MAATSEKTELKPCPFCEGDAGFIDGDQKQQYGNEQVGCTRCMALAAPEPTKQAAARRWNSRGDHPELDYAAAIQRDIDKLRTMTFVLSAKSRARRPRE